ncbi:BrnA antitoxin family protein [Pontivivens insulae]|uniref:BrnA antitoxin of type II toxin-antitoxin system n=1 Tax=Pontivivens insulae TaxID=1639689 RepID=A0A2R8AF36_9RHOB|nr:BrnA antitoxin family protein [Pontivivens insulae]RED11962.1 BrnA antitoxin of type II toxin-antitoxin system [Pontivivens insulae]SPF30718.1 hypothetical protein POI8812_03060 [Pontivivens insulae]
MADYTPPPERKQTREELRAETELVLWLSEQTMELKRAEMLREWVPADWADVERNVECRPARTRITLRVDADVARFFRKMGPGYQARMNAVLRTYYLSRKAKLITGPLDETVLGHPL